MLRRWTYARVVGTKPNREDSDFRGLRGRVLLDALAMWFICICRLKRVFFV